MCFTWTSSKTCFNSLIKMFAFVVVVALTFCIPVECQTNVVAETNTTHNNVIGRQEQQATTGFDDSDLSLQGILANLSILNVEADEYDATMMRFIENTTHFCLQQCMEEVMANCFRKYLVK